ncbi:MAG: hypothetical protein AAFN00_22230, partial [Cyanobacteria bacterium J06558_2]
MNRNTLLDRSSLTARQLLFVILFLNSLAITVAITQAVILDKSPQFYFEEIGHGGYITVISALQLLITGVISGLIFRIVKYTRKLHKTRFFWLIVALICLFLAVDDVLGIHESLDRWFHNLLQLQVTELTDLVDDLIVGSYLIGFLIYVACQWQVIQAFNPAFGWFKAGFILAAVMVLLDILSNNTLFISQVIDDQALIRQIREWLGVVEDSAKIFAE